MNTATPFIASKIVRATFKNFWFFILLMSNIAVAQLPITDPSPLQVCDDNNDGYAIFNLTTKNAEILGSLSPVDYTVSYHLTVVDAQTGANPFLNPNSYANNTPYNEMVYVRVQENANTSNFDTTTLSLVVLNQPPVPLVSTTPATCTTSGTAAITNYNAANTYTFTPAGPSVGAGGVISGLFATTACFYTVIASSGGCTSLSSSCFGVLPANCTHAINDINNTYTNTPVSGSVATNDYDLEGNTQVCTPYSGPISAGTLVLNSDGNYTFTPNTGFTGTTFYTYDVCDTGTPVACTTAVLTIEILPIPTSGANDGVTANNDIATTEDTTGVSIEIMANDFDVDGDTFTITSNTQPTYGSVSMYSTGANQIMFNYQSYGGFTGTDTFTYTICDNATPQACDTATVTIMVNPSNTTNETIANDDAYNGNDILYGNVLTNDTDPESNTQTVTSHTNPSHGTLNINPNGYFSYIPSTGFYESDSFTYTICDNGTPQACDTATVYLTTLSSIDAVVDVYPTQTSGVTPTTVGNVTVNDTLNGVPVTPSNTDVTPVNNGPLYIDANGVLTLDPNTPSGTYTITYTICEVDTATGLAVVPANCDTVTDTVTVLNPIDAVVDVYPTQSPSTTGPITVGIVYDNDTLNGVIVTANNTDVTPVTNGPLSIGADGVVILEPNTPSGVYPITYTICEVNPTTGVAVLPTNCDSVLDIVTVLNPIDAVVDVYPTQTPGTTTATTVGIVYYNDTLNGIIATQSNTDVTPVCNGPLCIDANGELTLAPNTPSGVYPITYTICEVNPTTGLAVVPANCDSATFNVTVWNNDLIISSDGTYVDANGDGLTNPGDEIHYAIVVTNITSTPINNIVVTDTNATITGFLSTLAGNTSDSTTFTGIHTITTTDIAAGQVNNLATATANGGNGVSSTDPTPCTSCNTVSGCPDCTKTPINRIGGGDTNIIRGTIHLDSDFNGCTSTDPTVSYQRVIMTFGTEQVETFTNTAGEYMFYAGIGAFTVSTDISTTPNYASVSPSNQTFTFTTNNASTSVQDFCITPGAVTDLGVSIYPTNSARPGFNVGYYIIYRNNGNTTINQTNGITLNFDDSKMDFVSSSMSVSNQATGVLQWNIINLLPGQSGYIYVSMLINSPTASVPVNIGTILPFTVSVTPPIGDNNTYNNSMSFNQIVVGSYDPNEIICAEGASLPVAEIGNYLHYSINFENTGNFPTEFITIKVPINTSDYDIASLQIEYSSHNAYLLVKDGFITIYFPNCIVYTGGHGNMLLKIKSKNTLQAGDTVSKRADIYFDYNAPIDTGFANTTYQNLSATVVSIDNSVLVYPNPTNAIVNIKANTIIKTIELYDVQGRLLQKQLLESTQTTIDISQRSKGIYFLKIISETGSKVEKIIKE